MSSTSGDSENSVIYGCSPLGETSCNFVTICSESEAFLDVKPLLVYFI